MDFEMREKIKALELSTQGEWTPAISISALVSTSRLVGASSVSLQPFTIALSSSMMLYLKNSYRSWWRVRELPTPSYRISRLMWWLYMRRSSHGSRQNATHRVAMSELHVDLHACIDTFKARVVASLIYQGGGGYLASRGMLSFREPYVNNLSSCSLIFLSSIFAWA